MGKYKIIKKCGVLSFLKEPALMLAASVITRDNSKDALLCQIKFQNLGKKTIAALYIAIRAFDPAGEKITGVDEFIYTDLNVSYAMFFGGNVPIPLSDKNTRHIEVFCKKIVYTDTSIWENKDKDEFEALPTLIPMVNELDSHLYKELETELHEKNIFTKNIYKPIKLGTIWQCACGEYNAIEQQCHNCGKTFYWWEQQLDEELLAESTNKKLQQIENEKQKKAKRRIIQLCLILSVIIVTIIILTIYLKNMNEAKLEGKVKIAKIRNQVELAEMDKFASENIDDYLEGFIGNEVTTGGTIIISEESKALVSDMTNISLWGCDGTFMANGKMNAGSYVDRLEWRSHDKIINQDVFIDYLERIYGEPTTYVKSTKIAKWEDIIIDDKTYNITFNIEDDKLVIVWVWLD